MAADALAFGGDERGGLLPRRLNHDSGRVAGFICLSLRHEIDAVMIETRPCCVAVAEHVERCARDREAPLVCACTRLEEVVAAALERDVERHWIGGCGDRPLARLNLA